MITVRKDSGSQSWSSIINSLNGGGGPGAPSGPSGGGPSTPPTAPPDYDPCGGGQNNYSSKLKVQQLASGGPCDPTQIPPTEPTISNAQYQTRFVVADIVSNLQLQYQTNYGLTDEQVQELADFIYSDNSYNISQNIYDLYNYSPNSDDDPPLVALLRRYVGIDDPAKTPEEAQQLVGEMARMGQLGQAIKQIHDTQRMIFGFIPGYLPMDDMMQGDYGSFAINASFDLFGGELLKYVTGPVLRVGSKYIIRAGEMVAKYPNIIGYFMRKICNGYKIVYVRVIRLLILDLT